MTSLTSGLPRRDTCVQPRLSFPPTVTFLRSVDDQMPIVCLRCRAVRSGSGARLRGRCSRQRSLCRRPCACAGLAEAEQVEDRADVAEEGVVTLAGEDLHAARRIDDRFRDGRLVVLDVEEAEQPRTDVVRRRRPLGERLAVPCDRERLARVAEEERARGRPEAERVRDVRPAVPGPVDLDVVAGAGRERVPVGARRGVFRAGSSWTRSSGCWACRGCGTRRDPCCLLSDPRRSAEPRGDWMPCPCPRG